MESFLIPLVILVVVVVLGLLVMKYLGGRSKTENDGGARGRSSRGPAAVASREEAVRASNRLNQQQHSAIYSLLARGDALNAIMEYRKATGAKLREAATAVASMSTYPQPHGAGRQQASGGAADTTGAGRTGSEAAPATTGPEAPFDGPGSAAVSEGAGSGEAPSDTDSDGGGRGAAAGGPAAPEAAAGSSSLPQPEAVADPGAISPQPQEQATGYRYRAIVSHGNEIGEIASTRLNDDVFARIKGSALAGDRDGAVRLLMEHSEADEQQARDFVRLIQPEPPGDPKG